MTQHEADILCAKGQVIHARRELDKMLDRNLDWSSIEVKDAASWLTTAKALLKRIYSNPETGAPYQRS